MQRKPQQLDELLWASPWRQWGGKTQRDMWGVQEVGRVYKSKGCWFSPWLEVPMMHPLVHLPFTYSNKASLIQWESGQLLDAGCCWWKWCHRGNNAALETLWLRWLGWASNVKFFPSSSWVFVGFFFFFYHTFTSKGDTSCYFPVVRMNTNTNANISLTKSSAQTFRMDLNCTYSQS